MPTVTKQAAFEASAPTVWALVREFGKLDEWLPPVVGCETDGEGIGALRTLTLGDGAVVVERLEAHDDAARTLTYSMTDAGPMPLVDYVSTIEVSANPDGTSTMSWTGSFGYPAPTRRKPSARSKGFTSPGWIRWRRCWADRAARRPEERYGLTPPSSRRNISWS